MLTPAYKLTIGRRSVDTSDDPQASTLVKLRVDLDMNGAADRALLVLGNVGGLRPAVGDEGAIELGYEDGAESKVKVLSGKVVAVEAGLTTTRVTIHSAADTLLHRFSDKTFENKNAGAIVRDLASSASVTVSAAESGIDFPAYVIDGRNSHYRHMKDLAELCGFDLYLDAEGKLVFKKFNRGNRIHTLTYAQHPIELALSATPPVFGEVQAWGESPGPQPSDAWAWLTKDFSSRKGSAGSGAPLLLLEKPALRTSTAAGQAAEAAQTGIARDGARGNVLLRGNGDIKLGDAIRIKDAPNEAANATWQVRAITHLLDKTKGFSTQVHFRAIASGPAIAGSAL